MNIHFLQKLQEREEKNLTRHLQQPAGIDFCSNDYLSFVSDVILQKKIYENLRSISSGSTSSRLIRGHQSEIERLEYELAKWSSKEAAIFFPSGYQANLAVLSTLLDETTLVFSDEFNHASIVDGIRLSKSAKIIFSHNNLLDLEQKLLAHKTHKNKIVVVESLYSMGGDRCPLKDLVSLCQKLGAQLIVDEAHATGVFGAGLVQRQSLESQVLLTVHCAGKALGVSGAWVACDQILKDYFINFSRPFIYSTAPSPLVISALSTSLNYWQSIGSERAELCLQKSFELKTQLAQFLDAQIIKGEGPILFIELGENLEALSWAQYLQSCELDVRAIRYPTVANNKAGLRISMHANQSPENIKKIVRAFKEKVLSC